MVKDVEDLKREAYRLKVWITVLPLAAFIACGVALATIPVEIAKRVAEARAQQAAEEFARTKLPGLVETILEARFPVQEIERLKEAAEKNAAKAAHAAAKASESAVSAAESASFAKIAEQEAKRYLISIKDSKFDLIRAKRIHVVDDEDKVRASFSVDESGPHFVQNGGSLEIHRNNRDPSNTKHSTAVFIGEHGIDYTGFDSQKITVGGYVDGRPGITVYDSAKEKVYEAFPVTKRK